MDIVLLVLSCIFLILLFVSFSDKPTWYRSLSRIYSIVFSVSLFSISVFAFFIHEVPKCGSNYDWFYNDNGTLCYNKENYSSLIATKHDNKKLKIISFTITSPERAEIKFDNGGGAVIYNENNKRVFGPYYEVNKSEL